MKKKIKQIKELIKIYESKLANAHIVGQNLLPSDKVRLQRRIDELHEMLGEELLVESLNKALNEKEK